jgi:hypothetical protein
MPFTSAYSPLPFASVVQFVVTVVPIASSLVMYHGITRQTYSTWLSTIDLGLSNLKRIEREKEQALP